MFSASRILIGVFPLCRISLQVISPRRLLVGVRAHGAVCNASQASKDLNAILYDSLIPRGTLFHRMWRLYASNVFGIQPPIVQGCLVPQAQKKAMTNRSFRAPYLQGARWPAHHQVEEPGCCEDSTVLIISSISVPTSCPSCAQRCNVMNLPTYLPTYLPT